jgi:hypothetical protein
LDSADGVEAWIQRNSALVTELVGPSLDPAFLQEDPRQTWCSSSCGNRERVNRYYQRRRREPTATEAG